MPGSTRHIKQLTLAIVSSFSLSNKTLNIPAHNGQQAPVQQKPYHLWSELEPRTQNSGWQDQPSLCARRAAAGLPHDCTLRSLTNSGSDNVYIYPNPPSIPAPPFTTSQGEVAQRDRKLRPASPQPHCDPGQVLSGLLISTCQTREQVHQGFMGV